jgi:hypothetical protein
LDIGNKRSNDLQSMRHACCQFQITVTHSTVLAGVSGVKPGVASAGAAGANSFCRPHRAGSDRNALRPDSAQARNIVQNK